MVSECEKDIVIMADLSAEERAQQLVGGNSWWKPDPWNLDVEFGNPPEVDEVRLVQLIADAIRDSERAAARRERERCAALLETKQVISSSAPPHWRLVDDADPDVVRRMYAAAIRALPD
jgi:hypothetical protein